MDQATSPAFVRPTSERAFLSGLSIVAYAGLFLALALPFVSISCGSRHTGPLTGYEVLAGEGQRHSSSGSTAVQEMNDALSFQRTLTIVMVVVAVLVVGISIASWSSEDGGVVKATLILGVLAMQAAASSLGSAFAVFAPEIHHHLGFWIALGLLTVGFLARTGYAATLGIFERRPRSTSLWTIFSAGLIVLMLPGPYWSIRVAIGLIPLAIGFVISLIAAMTDDDPIDMVFFVLTGLPLAFVVGSFAG